MSHRLSSCLGCAELLVLRASPPPSAVRLVHSSALLNRGQGPARKGASPHSSAYAGANRGRPGHQPWRRPKTGDSKPRPAPATLPVALAKLQQHVRAHWVKADAEAHEVARTLGIGWKRMAELAPAFGGLAVGDLERLIDEAEAGAEAEAVRAGTDKGKQRAASQTTQTTWDTQRFLNHFTSSPMDAVHDATLSAFVTWAATLPLPRATPSNPFPDPALAKLHQLAATTDLRFSGELHPDARQLRRKLILHVGPTNSGKTHQALVALARARTGAYAGPLRLLAHEVFSRFNEGKIGDEGRRACNLVTGEEQRIVDGDAGLESCTVEMFPLGKRLDVGVIDEIQMIGDPGRGTAWTNAILGSQCAELHLCGEESVVDLIKAMAAELGDECVVKRYQRLSPLALAAESLGGNLSKIRKGDCLVTFSRNNIFAFKRTVEEKTGLRVAVAYGGLPPEVREEQARVFNEGGYDVLVASDAVGMGLNLKINRIVFESMHKWDGKQEVQLATPQIKQIAGRAGRFGIHSKNPDSAAVAAIRTTTSGEVTTLDEVDLPILVAALATPTIPVTQAYHAAPLAAYRSVFDLLPEGTSVSKVQSVVNGLTRVAPHYVTPPVGGANQVLDAIEDVGPLTFAERMQFGLAPVNLRDDKAKATLVEFASAFARGEPVLMAWWSRQAGVYAALERVADARRHHELPAAFTLNGAPARQAAPPLDPELFTPTTLATLESFHRCLTLYLWLSYRLASIFCDQHAAQQLRKDVEGAIEFTLAGMKFERIERKHKKAAARHGYQGRGARDFEGVIEGGAAGRGRAGQRARSY